jgi:hypothetical protein
LAESQAGNSFLLLLLPAVNKRIGSSGGREEGEEEGVLSLSLSPSVRMRSGRAAGKSLRLRFWCATKNCVTCNSGGISSFFALLSPDLNLKAKEGGEEITSRQAASSIAFGSSSLIFQALFAVIIIAPNNDDPLFFSVVQFTSFRLFLIWFIQRSMCHCGHSFMAY